MTRKRTRARVRILLGLLLALISTRAIAAPPPVPDLRRYLAHTYFNPAAAQGNIGGGQTFLFDGSGNLDVNCITGCSASAGFTDNSAFTVGVSTISPIGAYFTSGAAPSISSGNSGRVRMDSNSYLYVDCVTGCSASAGFSDNTVFTAGTTSINITGGWYSSSPSNCTTGNACAPQLTIDRKLFVQDFQGTSPWVDSITTWASGTLGAMANYGTSPGAVLVPGVNAFITNTPAVTLTSTTITGNVNVVGTTTDGSTTEIPFLAVGGESNDATAQYQPIPLGAGGRSVIVEGFAGGTAVPVSGTFFQTTQPVSCTAANCAFNLAQEAGTAITNTPTAIGTLGTGNVISVNGDLTSEHGTAITNVPTAIGTLGSGNAISVNTDMTSEHGTAITTVPVAFGSGTPSGNAPGVNSACFVGTVACASGNGVSGTGNARVNLASDNTAIANWGQGATGSAVPTGAEYVGGNGSGNLTGIISCDNTAAVNMSTATTTQIIAISGTGGRTYICAINLVTNAANNVALISGSGTNCASNQAGLAGGTTAATGWNFAANSGLTIGSGLGMIWKTATTNNEICLITSAATQLSGSITYTQF